MYARLGCVCDWMMVHFKRCRGQWILWVVVDPPRLQAYEPTCGVWALAQVRSNKILESKNCSVPDFIHRYPAYAVLYSGRKASVGSGCCYVCVGQNCFILTPVQPCFCLPLFR